MRHASSLPRPQKATRVLLLDRAPQDALRSLYDVAVEALLVGRAEVVAVVVGLVVDLVGRPRAVEQRLAHDRLELGLDEPRPPRVHDPDRVGVVVGAVAVAVDAVRAARRPGPAAWRPRRRAPGPSALPRTRSASGSDVLPRRSVVPGLLHRVDHLRQRQLVAALQALRELAVEHLRAVDRAEQVASRRPRSPGPGLLFQLVSTGWSTTCGCWANGV